MSAAHVSMATATAAHAALVNATRASGVIVRVSPADFLTILRQVERPLVVVASGGMFKKHVKYLTSYKGLAFTTKSDAPLVLDSHVQIVAAEKIWLPQ